MYVLGHFEIMLCYYAGTTAADYSTASTTYTTTSDISAFVASSCPGDIAAVSVSQVLILTATHITYIIIIIYVIKKKNSKSQVGMTGRY